MEKERMNLPETMPIAKKYYDLVENYFKNTVQLTRPQFDLRLPGSYSELSKKFISKTKQNKLKKIIKKLKNEFLTKHFCFEPWQTFYVRADGTVTPCVITNRVLGDLNKSNAEEIWNGELFRKFRERMKSAKKPYECLRCHLFPGPKRYDKELDNIDEYEPL